MEKFSDSQETGERSWSASGAGFGRKTVAHIISENNLDLQTAAENLAKYNIEFKENVNLRSLSNGTDFTPYYLVEIMKGNFDKVGKTH